MSQKKVAEIRKIKASSLYGKIGGTAKAALARKRRIQRARGVSLVKKYDMASAYPKIIVAEQRVLLLAERWAAHMVNAEVLSSPSHHLLRAVQKLRKLKGAPLTPAKPEKSRCEAPVPPKAGA